MDVLLSVIIPVYNGKETIGKCLESILAQAGVELEIICVDDESTDDTLKLLEDLAKEEQRIRVLTQRNGGVASARNTGLRNAKGTYVTFIDQDDWVESDAYQTMLSLIKEYDADMAVCNYTKDYDDKIVKMLNRGTIAPIIETTEDIIQYAFYREEYRGFAAYVWNKIFRREFLEKNALCFGGKLKRGDDVLFISEVALHEPKTVYVDRYFYHYVQRSDSITHTMTRGNLSRLSDILVAYELSIHALEANKVTDDVIDYMKCFYVFHAADLYELAKKENMAEEKDKLREAMKKYLKEYKHQNADYEERLIRIEELINDRGM